MAATGDASTKVFQWVLDTRQLWPQATQTAQLKTHASRQLALLSSSEQADVLKYIHVRDAKMALGSRLLKRYLIARFAGRPSKTNIPWDDAVTTRNKDTKPVFIHPKDGSEPLIFNVSHQNGLVALVGALSAPKGVTVGVDIVCPTERRVRDHDMIKKEGWQTFVRIHDEVLCPAEVNALNALPFGSSPADLDRKLRYFYALWCLREAYVKMTGEALLAPWLKVLEMRHFAPPEEDGSLEIWFEGKRVENVDIDLVYYLDNEFMISTSVGRSPSGESLTTGQYEFLDIQELTAYGEAAIAGLVEDDD
jgi:4'-phosphopantetheinyl transferase